MGFVSTVVLPIQKLQLQIEAVQQSVSDQKLIYTNIVGRLIIIEKDHVLFLEKMK